MAEGTSAPLSFQSFVDKSFWALLMAGCAIMMHQVGQLNKSVAAINTQTVILVERSTTYQKTFDDLGTRVAALEAWRQAIMMSQAITTSQANIAGASSTAKPLLR